MEKQNANFLDASTIPDDPSKAEEAILVQTFWDPAAGKPFKIAG